MKKIWIVWEGDQMDKIFSTKELAEKYISAHGDINPVLARDLSIGSWEVHDNVWTVAYRGDTAAVFSTKELAEEYVNKKKDPYMYNEDSYLYDISNIAKEVHEEDVNND